jgi:hypothetical protein
LGVSDDTFENIAIGIFIVLVISLLTGLAMIMENWSCKSKWEHAGMAGITWGPVQGCLVKLPDGRWLPEERIREIDIPKTERK